MTISSYHFPPIGFLKTPFTEKFGVPRQSLMMSEAWGVVKLNDDPQFAAALNHLEQFSHLWLVFVFHKEAGKPWRPTIEPPRLDVPKNIGVLASRSPHRPNPIGLSAVKLKKIDWHAAGGIEIQVSGVDLLDQTPILDLKPYLPFADSLPAATEGWAKGEIDRFAVTFSDGCLLGVEERTQHLIRQMLEWDPRPTSQRKASPLAAAESQGLRFAFRVLDFDVKWEVRDGQPHVLELVRLSPSAEPLL